MTTFTRQLNCTVKNKDFINDFGQALFEAIKDYLNDVGDSEQEDRTITIPVTTQDVAMELIKIIKEESLKHDSLVNRIWIVEPTTGEVVYDVYESLLPSGETVWSDISIKI